MTLDQFIVFALLGLVLFSFFKEIYPPEVTALAGTAVLLAVGIIDTKEFLSVFSSGAPITIAMMFILSAALERTGVLQVMGDWLGASAKGSYLRAVFIMMVMAIIASAFMNNTPVVILLAPVMIAVSAQLGSAPSKFLIPLSYAAILGGTLTVGTSTNILMSGITTKAGLPAIGMFEMTGIGLVFAAVGLVYMLFAVRYLLPERQSMAGVLGQGGSRRFMARLLVPAGSRYVGKTLSELPFTNSQSRVVDVLRGEQSLRNRLDGITLQAGDRIVVKTGTGEILALKEDGQIEFRDVSDQGITLEASVGPNSRLIGRLLNSLDLRRTYGVYVMAVHRQDRNISKEINTLRLHFADTLLLEGPAEGLQRLAQSEGLINLSAPQESPIRRQKAPIAIASILGVMVLAALNVMPIEGLALIGAVLVMMTRCIEPQDAFDSIDWNILFLIYGMLGFSIGMEKTGAVQLVVDGVMHVLGHASPIVILAMVYVLTSALTEMVSNNAVAVLVGPLAISLAQQLGLDPRPFIMAVMFAASASFATPIGYQTNTFVYSAGGYKFRDFITVGLPLNIIFVFVAMVAIPLFFPF
jgi:di/tricarboxylate transporter